MVLILPSCTKLSTFIPEDEAKQALIESLQKSNETSSIQNQNSTLMYENTASRIAFPQAELIQSDILQTMPMGQETYDNMLIEMNNQACILSKEYKPVIANAINNTTFDDIYSLIETDEARATAYLKLKQENAIRTVIAEIIETKLASSDFLIAYKSFQDTYNFLSKDKVLTQDLASYLTDKITARYFNYMAIEEHLIRSETSHQSSTLLSKVFANN